MTTSYTDIQNTFEQRKNNPMFNTSYPLSPTDWDKYRTAGALPFDFAKPIAFYLHVPFCQQICSFCEYTRTHVPSHEAQSSYIETLLNDAVHFIESIDESIQLYGFDIGGGTPTSLNDQALEKLITGYNCLLSRVRITEDFEPSIEGTFQSLTPDKIGIIASGGIKRMSLGVQSVGESIIKPMHRQNCSLTQMKETLMMLHRKGVEKVNLDLMYGLPGQTVASIKMDVECIKALSPEQVTVYEFRTNQIRTGYRANSDTCYRQYCTLFEELTNLGYLGVFGQNTFSLDAQDCGLSSYLRHRMFNGWQYKGFGISAQSMSPYGVSYNSGKNCAVSPMLERNWLTNNNNSYEPTSYYKLPRQEIVSKFIAISGYSGGFSLTAAQVLFGGDFSSKFQPMINFLLKNDLAVIRGERLQITEVGFRHYGAILSLFYYRI